METIQIKVGDYIRGFKVEHTAFELDDKYIGLISKVIIVSNDGTIKVEYEDGTTWWYYTHHAIEHLCNDPLKPLDTLVIDKTIAEMLQDVENPLKETPFHKPDFNHLKDIDKYLDDKAKNSGLNKTPIEELESHFKEPKLYSVLLSLGKMRMVYIDQTEEDVEQIKKQSPNWHTIIVEQQQDKGIQIIIKS